MIEKLIAKQAHPWCLWSKLGVLLLFPSFIYAHEVWAVLGFLILQVIFTFAFPIPPKELRIDFAYHAIRGMFLEFTREAEHYSAFWRRIFGSPFKKILVINLYIFYFLFSVYLLWEDYLIFGSVLYYVGVSLVFSVLTDYADISKVTPKSKRWDELLKIEE